MALPETDLHRIRLWARERVPEHLWDEVKVEVDVSDRHVDIVEVRPPWDGVGEHTRFPIARLRYTKATGVWAIYWRDRNLKFHEACTRIESAVRRPVNPTILTPEEFAASSGFLDNVRSGSAVAVIGELPWH